VSADGSADVCGSDPGFGVGRGRGRGVIVVLVVVAEVDAIARVADAGAGVVEDLAGVDDELAAPQPPSGVAAAASAIHAATIANRTLFIIQRVPSGSAGCWIAGARTGPPSRPRGRQTPTPYAVRSDSPALA
jgi:hypothetical protein